ncbi:MAG: hypothetical protein GY856_21415 [bacterium]|nr:hypothetical protein [bacterium]
MRDRVEEHAAELLAAAIRPQFEDRFRAFWSRVERCCSDRYPFITNRQLSRARAAYERYQPGGIWLPQAR